MSSLRWKNGKGWAAKPAVHWLLGNPMSFAEHTGKIRRTACPVCGVEVEQEDVHMLARRLPPGSTWWEPRPHRAPCGAHCVGGGTEREEQDVHTPPFGACPRCGATNSEIARIIERPDAAERAVFHRYTAEYCRSNGFRVDLEQRHGESWRVVSRWNVHHPESFDEALRKACNYISWLNRI